MDRRNFIKRGTLAPGIVAAGAVPRSDTASPRKRAPAEGVDIEAYLETLDAGVKRISRWPVSESFPGLAGRSNEHESLVRNAVHSLYITGMFGDLPVEAQLDPRMQDRLWASQPVMDEALDRVNRFLQEQTPDRLARVRTTLRKRPGVLAGVIRTIDAEAARSGLSEPRRDQLRTMFTEVGWRLEHQPPRLIVDEYLTKVRKAVAVDIESAARQRRLAARVGEDAFWLAQESLRDRRISRGLKAMGIGALAFLAGLALVSIGDDTGDGDVLTWIGLVPGITGGSVLFVVGLVILLVGLGTSEDES